ncbi:MAG: FAD-dependent thymidylate synthase [Deinococcus sp.]|nr:FAD-dependent thymidylate synthase [Deinococcus sp.]
MLYPLNDGIGTVELVQHAGNDKMIVNAARVSFAGHNNNSLDERDKKLIRYLLEHNHGSPFEHNLITFRIVCPIFIDRQIVRHRAGVSKNEVSGRYVELKQAAYIPQGFRQQSVNNRQASIPDKDGIDQAKAHQVFINSWQQSYAAYEELISLGVAREQARAVLPLSLYTESYYTFNLRSLLHFISLREHEGAQWEIQQYAKAMAEIAEPLFPATFSAWRELKAIALQTS